MANRTIPARLNNFNIYGRGNKALGVATVTLPSLEAMSDTLTGAGLLGEIDLPTLGHFGSTEVEMEWNTISSEAAAFSPGVNEDLTFRGAMQLADGATGQIDHVGVRVVVRGIGKNWDLGSAEVGAATGTTTTIEALYIKIVIDGKDVLELDKLNNVYKVNGKDLMAKINSLI